MKPIMNGASEKTLLAIINNMPQSLLIYGPDGVGTGTIAKYVAQLCGIVPIIILPEKDEKIDIEKGTMSVGAIRRLYDESRTMTADRRMVIIDYAERMTQQAQNAFLKLLEEPGSGIHFVLVSHSAQKLLPTVLSRTEKLEVRPISVAQSNKLLDNLSVTDDKKRTQLLFMASGLPAEITRLANDPEYFDKRSAVMRDARELLRGSLYQKLLIAQHYKDDRSSALILINDTMSILKRSISDNPRADAINHIDGILDAYQQIEANGNIRLCLARMVI